MNEISFLKSDFEKYTTSEEFANIRDIKTVVELLDYLKNNFNDLNAFYVFGSGFITYDKFINDVNCVCKKLKDLNVEKKTNIGVFCENSYFFAVASFAIMAYGSVAVLLPPQLDGQKLYGCSLKYNLKGLFCSTTLIEKTTEFNLNLNFILSSDKMEFNQVNECFFDNNIKPSDPSCIIMTGGTTGKSKGAVLAHTALMCGMINGCYGLKNFMHQKYYCIMPLTHVFGFIRNLLTSMYTGSCIAFNVDKKAMFNEIPAYKPTILVIVPALAELFLNLTKAYGMNMLGGEVKTIICGAASVPPYLIQEYNHLGINFCPGYGLTEFSNMVSGNPEGLKYPDSVGMLFPEQVAKVVNGELWLKGRNMMIEYYNEPEENKSAFEDGWFKTGDLCRFDENGYLYIIGRSKDVIVLSNGENVSPAYIESKINELNFIQDSLVTEDHNEYGNEILKVEVLLRNTVFNTLNIKEDEVQKFVEDKIFAINDSLQDYERISKVVIRTKDFDRTPSMKIIRPKKIL